MSVCPSPIKINRTRTYWSLGQGACGRIIFPNNPLFSDSSDERLLQMFSDIPVLKVRTMFGAQVINMVSPSFNALKEKKMSNL